MQKKKVQCFFESSEINISFINMIASICHLLMLNIWLSYKCYIKNVIIILNSIYISSF